MLHERGERVYFILLGAGRNAMGAHSNVYSMHSLLSPTPELPPAARFALPGGIRRRNLPHISVPHTP